ncbi:hydrogenase expression/formation protein [Albimonas sp. CAU 1670]|uniref:hydrogenase expression/formation protein n=1 Tax=Albimonas sp. CAU 1670 TaxID=3032599 RepID=UPI0023DBCF14|nr:hydrogenase expression/formation protein [Albimonas sp. CAU 1670]MDF2235640.1 hydrogenase expression/formation protein [Albimonas sp. CAU 1670]
MSSSIFTLPPTGFGPGSQPLQADDELQYTAMPQGMRTYSQHTPEVDDLARVPRGAALMRAVAAACARAAEGGEGQSFDLADLPPADRAFVADVLGEGEVSIRIRGVPAVAVQESVFAGVWALKGVGVDRIEVAPIPALALSRAADPVRPALGLKAPMPGDLANALSILTELQDLSARPRAADDAPEVVNLTLLPHTEGDLDFLAAAVGEGSTTILSRGYGACRIEATALPRLWRVRFFNAMDVLILDTFEATTVPEAALAAPEDLADSAERILDVLETLR